jgi:hypothetical protein
LPANPQTGSIAAHARWVAAGTADRQANTDRMLAGQDLRYAHQAFDPDGKLTDAEFAALLESTPADEIVKRVNNARVLHMKRASLAAIKARAARKKAS